MTDEEIIRHEAKLFSNRNFNRLRQDHVLEKVNDIKLKLNDYYSPEAKSIFLDEIQKEMESHLQKHRDEAHQGVAQNDCPFEIGILKLSFFIRQEINSFPIIAHLKAENNNILQRNKVFVSYSHFDQEILADVKRHFKPFIKDLDFWDDTRILPGQIWKEEIRKAINETKIAILLVSTDFLGSDFITTNELPPLLEAADKDGATILVVILKPVLFEEFPSLNKFQTMNPPNKPLSKMDTNEKEDLLVNLVRQTKRIIQQ